MENREVFRLCGVITGVTKRISKKDNKPWAIVTLATTRETYTVNAFAGCYEKSHPQLVEGALVLLEGQIIRRRDDEVQLAANSVAPLEGAIGRIVRGVTFFISGNGQACDFVETLRTELESAMGSTPVRLGVLLDDHQAVLADLASSLEWNIDRDQLNRLRKHPAVRGLRIDVRPAEAPEPEWKRRRA
ncbi:MAG: hypothetical protein RL648_1813, partial [Verrucomicrobiota bacterium]